MSAHPNTPVLLRRIARLEATVGRLSEDFADLNAAVCERAGQAARSARKAVARKVAPSPVARPTAEAAQGSSAGGFAEAVARGEAARVRWVKEGLVVPGEQLAHAWGLTRQALAPASERGEIFSVKVGNRLYYPQPFLELDREAVAAVCRALGDLGSSEKLIFWLREHGALSGKCVGAALESGISLARVERLAGAWARERGATRVAAAA